MCGGGGGIGGLFKNITKSVGSVFKSVGSIFGLGGEEAPEFDIPENKGIATENMGTGQTGALVELGANDELKAQRVSGGGSGGRTRSGLSRMAGGSGLGF